MSERRACKLLEITRATYRYEPRPDRNVELREELVALARQKPRYGYRRLHALLERSNQAASVMRVYRLYRAEGLAVRRLRRKRFLAWRSPRTWPPRLNMNQLNVLLLTLTQKMSTGQLRPVIASNGFRFPLCAITASSDRVTRRLDRLVSTSKERFSLV